MLAGFLKARFHYERGKEHSLFVFFALASILTPRFNRRSIKETKNALFHACRGNGPLKSFRELITFCLMQNLGEQTWLCVTFLKNQCINTA